MRIGLIDVDSKIPNLALMKISAWHKAQGDDVSFYLPLWSYDKTYASKVFDFTPDLEYLPDGCIVGGTGYDSLVNLPREIEFSRPDYTLYPACDYSIGFITRGCIRHCEFCKVPTKEGGIKFNQHWTEFKNPKGKWFMFLDNNILAYSDVKDILSDMVSSGIKVDFNQALDIRLTSEYIAELLVKIKWHTYFRFSFDSPILDKIVKNKVKMMNEMGMKSYRMLCYVLIGFDTTPEEDLYRVELLRELGVNPFVMPYNKFNPYQKRFARWVNHKAIFKTVKWSEYKKGR